MYDFSRSFGGQSVTPAQRQKNIRRIFSQIALRYDFMNDLMSFGIHRLWKRILVKMIAPASEAVLIDLAGGTGDVARLLVAEKRHVIVCDPSIEMMAVGKRRRSAHDIDWLGGEGEAIPLANNCADVVVIAFGIRNVTRLDAVLAEIRRVLKPGGQIFCLEFSQPYFWLRPFYRFYSRWGIPLLGALISGNRDAYQYLVDSIEEFPHQQAFADILEQAGFTSVFYRNLSCGIACIHVGTQSGS